MSGESELPEGSELVSSRLTDALLRLLKAKGVVAPERAERLLDGALAFLENSPRTRLNATAHQLLARAAQGLKNEHG
jgi:hypothetical protein